MAGDVVPARRESCFAVGFSAYHHFYQHSQAVADGSSNRGGYRPNELTTVETRYTKELAYLLQQLDSIREPDGSTLLDGCLVYSGRRAPVRRGSRIDRLADISWLHNRVVHYWGDIDTHGFAMLDLLRAKLPVVRSLLMDRETLLAHSGSWGEEPVLHEGPLVRLTEPDRRLYEELRAGILGVRVRLEQERVGYSWVEQALGATGG